jgi:hypothetical protein
MSKHAIIPPPIYLTSALLTGALCLGPLVSCYADGNQPSAEPRYQRPTTRQYNDRLPPVMPGEEIVTETDQKMKTWSSSGPVPVNRRPPPQAVGNGVVGGGVGVIVDGRDRFGGPPNPPDGAPSLGIRPR